MTEAVRRPRKPRAKTPADNWTPEDIAEAPDSPFKPGVNQNVAARKLGQLLLDCSEGKDLGMLERARALALFSCEVSKEGVEPEENARKAFDLAVAASNRLREVVYARNPKKDGGPRITPFGSRLRVVMAYADIVDGLMTNLEKAYDVAYDRGQTMKRQNTFTKAMTYAKSTGKSEAPTVKEILKIAEYRTEREPRKLPDMDKILANLTIAINQLRKHGVNADGLNNYIIDHVGPQIRRLQGVVSPPVPKVSDVPPTALEELGFTS